jgi:hypothetical protein
MGDLMERGNIEGPLTEDEIQTFMVAVEQNPRHGTIIDGFCVKREKMIEAIDESGEFVEIEMDKLKAGDSSTSVDNYEAVIVTISTFLLQLVSATSRVVAERDSHNHASEELPPVLPVDLCMIASRDFTASLQRQKIRLKQKMTDDSISKIDQQFRELRIAYREEQGMKRCLKGAHRHHQEGQSGGYPSFNDGEPPPRGNFPLAGPPAGACSTSRSAVVSSSSFRKAWIPLNGRFKELREYCAGVATVMPGTSCVESDFSLINWTRDPNCAALTDFSLEAILHCKQFAKLQKLVD